MNQITFPNSYQLSPNYKIMLASVNALSLSITRTTLIQRDPLNSHSYPTRVFIPIYTTESVSE